MGVRRAGENPTSTTGHASPRRALVTGAASGLGFALATQLSARGDRVLATDVALDRPASLPHGVDYLPLDVRSDAAWAAALAHVTKHWGGLDLLINNAGVASAGGIEAVTLNEWHRVIDINLMGVVRGSRTFTPMLRAQGSGHIVNIASVAGLTAPSGMVAYSTTKAGVVALSEGVGRELAEFGVTVSVVCPYFFQSNISASLEGTDSVTQMARHIAAAYSKASADDVAAVVMRGIDARKDIILTDVLGHFLWCVQRVSRPLYRWLLTKAIARGTRGFTSRADGPVLNHPRGTASQRRKPPSELMT